MSNKDHMRAVAKRMVERIKTKGEAITKNYLLGMGWNEYESNWIIKEAEFHIEKENKL